MQYYTSLWEISLRKSHFLSLIFHQASLLFEFPPLSDGMIVCSGADIYEVDTRDLLRLYSEEMHAANIYRKAESAHSKKACSLFKSLDGISVFIDGL